MKTTNLCSKFNVITTNVRFKDPAVSDGGLNFKNLSLGQWVCESVKNEEDEHVGFLFYIDGQQVSYNDSKFKNIGFFNIDTASSLFMFNLPDYFDYHDDDISFGAAAENARLPIGVPLEVNLLNFYLSLSYDCSIEVDTICNDGVVAIYARVCE
jgi:hypothetical protein